MAKKKIVGQVTPEEKNEIQRLFERRNGLNELAHILGQRIFPVGNTVC